MPTQDAFGEEVPVAERRIRPEELAKAVAAIEARKVEEARALAGTILIGEAVRDMALDFSAEEVWAEIQARRAQLRASEAPAQNTADDPEPEY